ncbi:dTDP-4-dehydrorhamnose reductase [uncultured bacterium]|nr:dTDP-4-dehydrorhamnose reductase [uncultured bacterium]
MKVLVTGAKGQLASDLVPLLEAAGFTPVPFSSAELDISDRAAVFEAVKRTGPGLIVNPAAYTKVDLAEKEKERAYAVNAEGAENLAAAAAACGCPIVHVSTDFVFDGRSPAPYSEEAGTNPLSVYGASKLSGEKAVAAANEAHVVVRTSWLYGTNGHNFVKTILRLASERESLRVVYDQAGTPTWSADLAAMLAGICKAIESGQKPWGLYHYSNEGVASWYDFAVAICEEAASLGMELKCGQIEPILTSEYPVPAARPAYSVLNKAKIKKTFGASIPHWRRSLSTMLKELKGS